MSDVTNATETTENAVPSRKREITAVVVTTVVSVSLGWAASVLIDKVANRVKTSIAPTTESE